MRRVLILLAVLTAVLSSGTAARAGVVADPPFRGYLVNNATGLCLMPGPDVLPDGTGWGWRAPRVAVCDYGNQKQVWQQQAVVTSPKGSSYFQLTYYYGTCIGDGFRLFAQYNCSVTPPRDLGQDWYFDQDGAGHVRIRNRLNGKLISQSATLEEHYPEYVAYAALTEPSASDPTQLWTLVPEGAA